MSEKNAARVTAFLSYKGGVGRTFLLVHMAHILCHLGKRVIILDLDLEAPGVLSKFGIDPFEYELPGFVDLVCCRKRCQSEQRRELFKKSLFKVEPAPSEDIQQSDQTPNAGSIHILATGRPGKEDSGDDGVSYWHELFQSRGYIRDATVDEVSSFLREEVIPFCKAHADHVLIDTRAGITHSAAMAFNCADTLVHVFADNAEARNVRCHVRDGLVKQQLAAAKDPSRHAFSYHLVLNRLPSGFALSKKIEEEWRAAVSLPDPECFHLVSADAACQLDEAGSFLGIAEPHARHLHSDVTDLFRKLFPDVCEGVSVWELLYKKSIWITDVMRYLSVTSGVLLNSDGNRNVMFKVETFLRMLGGFRSIYGEDGGVRYREILKETGRVCGEAFGKSYLTQLEKEYVESRVWNDDKNVANWLKFDSEVGFGDMRCERLSPLGETPRYRITTNNLFLLPAEGLHRDDYPILFLGYVEGVTAALLKSPNVKATVEQAGDPYIILIEPS